VNKGTSNWGNAGYDTAQDVARFKVKPMSLPNMVSTFTIDIADITFNSCNINLMWEKTGISLPVKANNEERLSTNIEKAISTPNIPYYAAASYYFETNQKLDKAYEYVNKAVEANPKAFYMWHLKAKIAQKLGKKDDGVAAAQKSIETAKGTAFEADYVRNNEKIISDLKKM
jgi:tetratricopeptide (TPR) repeat protein